MSIDPRTISDKTGVPEEDVRAVLGALDDTNGDTEGTDERSPEDIIETHEAFIKVRTASEPPASSSTAPAESSHHDPDVQRHRENVQRLIDNSHDTDRDGPASEGE